MRLIFWDTLVDSTWYKAEILLKTGEDQWSMRPHVPKGMKRRSSTLAPVIRKAFISHHLLLKNIYCEISQNQEDDLAKNLVPTPHRMNTKDFDHPLTVNVAPSSGQSFKLSTIYSNTGFYTNAHNRKDGHLITAGAAPLFVFIWLTYIKKHTFKKCVQQVSEERAAFTLVPEERHMCMLHACRGTWKHHTCYACMQAWQYTTTLIASLYNFTCISSQFLEIRNEKCIHLMVLFYFPFQPQRDAGVALTMR